MMRVGPAGPAAVFLAFAILVLGSAPAASEPHPGEPIFESASLRIYRVLDNAGRPRLLLTNLDEDGNRLAPEEEQASPAKRIDSSPPSPAEPRTWDSPGTRPESEEREIHVDAGEDNVVRVDDGNGTTIIININPPPPPAPAEQVIVPAMGVPWIGWGSITGGYRYPDELPFLGYTSGVGSPSWMGGLGLNAGNGYGLSTAKPCGRGFDCMFPPTTPRP
jgi:hypothetical protein